MQIHVRTAFNETAALHEIATRLGPRRDCLKCLLDNSLLGFLALNFSSTLQLLE